MTAIVDIIGREILDSRGNPTVEVDVVLEDGSLGRAAVPSGASTGAHEAVELRDGDKSRYLGKGVRKAVDAVNGEIFDALAGMEAEEQVQIDQTMIDLDGTPNKSRLGANAILGVSLAVAKAAAESFDMPLYRYVGGTSARTLPVPMMNIINGGVHADNPIDFQEFMIMPVGAPSFSEALRMGVGDLPHPEEGAARRRPQHQCRRRGRFCAQPADRPDEALELHHEGDRKGRLQARRATSCWRSIPPPPNSSRTASMSMKAKAKACSVEEQAKYLADLASRYPIVSIEDGMAEDDLDGWKALTDLIGSKCQLVGDDLFVTNVNAARRRHQARLRQLDPDQGQPDRHPDRNARRDRDGLQGRLHRRDVAPLRRDRGFHHRRSRGRHQLRPDQDRLAGALRPHRQIQPAAAHRAGAGQPGEIRGQGGAEGAAREAVAVDRCGSQRCHWGIRAR